MTEKAKETVKISVGTFLQLGSILAITVLSFALVKAQANENSRNQARHEATDEKQWDKAFTKIEKNEESIHRIENFYTALNAQYAEILRRLESGEQMDQRILDKLEEFEVVQ